MSFDDEWAQLKSAASDKSPSMQLAGTGSDASGPGGKPRLKVTGAVLRKKAEQTDKHRGDFQKADDDTVKQTEQVKKSLTGFRSAGAFDTFVDRWKTQMRHLQGELEQGVAGGLRSAAATFKENDRFAGGKDKNGKEEKVAR